MPDIDAMAPSRFLKKAHLQKPRLATIKVVQTENVAPQNRTPDIKPVVYFEEFTEGVPVGKEQREQLKMIFETSNTDLMKGRQVVILVDPNVVYGGQRVGGIRFRAPRQRPPGQDIPAASPPPAAPPQGWSNAVAPTESLAGGRQDPPWMEEEPENQNDYPPDDNFDPDDDIAF